MMNLIYFVEKMSAKRERLSDLTSIIYEECKFRLHEEIGNTLESVNLTVNRVAKSFIDSEVKRICSEYEFINEECPELSVYITSEAIREVVTKVVHDYLESV